MTTLIAPAQHTLSALRSRWLPAFGAGAIAWCFFLLLGETPLIRASGMALAVVGMAAALRPMGAVLAIVGALALAFSPSFWVQTGGAQALIPLEVLITFGGAGAAGAALLLIRRRPGVALAGALAVFAVIFLTAVGTPRSLRVTTFLAVWLIALLTEGTFAANPRADAVDPPRLGWQHTIGLLLMLAIGIANDPLFALFTPAIALGVFLMRVRVSWVYWVTLVAIGAVGAWGVFSAYVSPAWWGFPSDQTPGITTHVPFLIASAWREPQRWIEMIELIVWQFSPVGIALGVIGLARLSRWHPPVGVVTMVIYGMYLLFGLCYFGEDSPVLLLPLLMIQVFWMTYAVYTFAAWARGVLHLPARWVNLGAAAAFTLLPLIMLLRIAGVV